MKVLSTGDYVGNITNSIAQFELLIGLKKKGVDLIIVANFTDEILKKFTDAGITCIKEFPTSKVDFDYIKNIKKYVTEYKIDIIHAFHGNALRNTIVAVKDLPVKLITYMGSTSIHWHDPSAYFTYLSPRVDKIICNSDYVYKHVRNQLFGKRKQKAIRIHKGYNPEWFAHIVPFDFSTLGISEDTTVVCLAANYLKVKGIEYYIKATYHIDPNTNIRFLLLGDMRGNKAVPELIEKSPLKEKIMALGSRSDAVALFKAADIYVQTSIREGFGRAISEAMCAKLPVVMTDAGGCTELIDEQSGIVVEKKNPKAIANGIMQLVNNKELRKQMGQNAYDRILNVYPISKTVEETLDLYHSVLED